MINSEGFYYRNHPMIKTYFKALLEEVHKVREQLLATLTSYRETGIPDFKINCVNLTCRELANICLLVITDEPRYVFWNWNCLDSESEAREVLSLLENYLQKISGARMPTKDPLIIDWMNKKITEII